MYLKNKRIQLRGQFYMSLPATLAQDYAQGAAEGAPDATLVADRLHLERHRCRQRHWFGCFKRPSTMVSTSKEMVELTMALLARLWVNGNQDELFSLLD
jgi:hypothetical protein